MTMINLLPWREQLRVKRKKDFGIMLIFSLVLSVSLVGGAFLFMRNRIHVQMAVNQFYNEQLIILEQKIKKVEEIKKIKANLVARIKVIQNLESTRPAIVHLLDELPRIVPAGVYLTNLTKEKNIITIMGDADSNSRVSALMRNIDASPWMADPVLTEIKSDGANVQYSRDFALQVRQEIPENMNFVHNTSVQQGTENGSQ